MYGPPSNEPELNAPLLLALVRVAIAPAAGRGRRRSTRQYSLAQRLERFDDDVDRLVPGVLRVEVAEDRHVGVVVVDVRAASSCGGGGRR